MIVSAFWVVASGLIGGLLALYAYVSDGWVILAALGILAVIVAVLVGSVYLTGRRHRDDYDYTGEAADEHMEPLRQPGDAEKTLAIDLGRRRMLLPGKRPQGRHAAQPAPAEAHTETIPVVTEPAVPEPTEVIPVVAGEPDTLYGDWRTGEFARDVWLLGVSQAGDES